MIVHGFNGSKSNRKFVKIARKFTKAGIAVLRFDFSGCGDSEGDFENMSIFQQVEDLRAAFKFLINQSEIDKKRIGFLGYSLGALIVSLFQKEISSTNPLVLVSPALEQKTLLSLWLNRQEIEKWQKNKFFDMPKCRVGIKYLNEIKNYNYIVFQIEAPILIIHGSKDKDVPVKLSQKLFKLLKGKKKIIIIKDGDHSLENYNVLNKLINYSLNWFKKHLSS